MRRIVVCLPSRVKARVRRLRRSTRSAGLAMRCQIVLLADNGRTPAAIAEAVGCSRSWAWRVIGRFLEQGEAGLMDRREDNGELKVDESYLDRLIEVVARSPGDYGRRRPTWTRELLVAVMKRLTGTTVHVSTMSRALKQIAARRGRPRPVVRCPWSKRAKNKRLRQIRDLLENLPAGEVGVYQDEVDIHLNPKIGLDWMNRSEQKEVVTPGKNEKRYLAGAMNPHTGQLTVVEGKQKRSALFIAMLDALAQDYGQAKRIHVVLDNYRIHKSKITKAALARHKGRIVLHFLPPYCPNENKIERLWLDLHSEVTRNHACETMNKLMRNVRCFLRKRTSATHMKIRRLAA